MPCDSSARWAGGVKERKIIVYDGTGQLYAPLELLAKKINDKVDEDLENKKANTNKGGFGEREKYFLEKIEVDELTDEKRNEISQKIKDGEYYAFLEIPSDIIEQKKAANGSEQGAVQSNQIIFRSQNSTLAAARVWMERSLTDIVTALRLVKYKIDPEVVKEASQKVSVQGKGLFELDADGKEVKKKEKSELATIFMPFGVMMLMFMVIFLAAQPALESVLEEKSQKIAEVLLGSANPFQLMIGKLLGVVGGSLTVFSVYITGICLLLPPVRIMKFRLRSCRGSSFFRSWVSSSMPRCLWLWVQR